MARFRLRKRDKEKLENFQLIGGIGRFLGRNWRSHFQILLIMYKLLWIKAPAQVKDFELIGS